MRIRQSGRCAKEGCLNGGGNFIGIFSTESIRGTTIVLASCCTSPCINASLFNCLLEYEATAKPQDRLNMHLVPIFLVMNPIMPMTSGVYRPCDELCNFSFVLLPGHRVSLPKRIANINNPLYINHSISSLYGCLCGNRQ